MRTLTRRERHSQMDKTYFPVEVACINFGIEKNVLHAARAAACFGAKKLHMIGNCELSRNIQRAISGTAIDFVDLHQYSNPKEFLDYCELNDIKIIALELPEDCGLHAEKIGEYKFDPNQRYVIASGHETSGLSAEILYHRNTDLCYIPMFANKCLNTSQSINVALYEYTRQMQFSR